MDIPFPSHPKPIEQKFLIIKRTIFILLALKNIRVGWTEFSKSFD